jgi:hypothetical protein
MYEWMNEWMGWLVLVTANSKTQYCCWFAATVDLVGSKIEMKGLWSIMTVRCLPLR